MSTTSPPPDDDGRHPQLEPVFAELREAFLVDPDEAVADRHLAGMFAARSTGVIDLRARRSGRRRALTLVAGATAGALVLGGGLAAAQEGALPDPVQDLVAAVAAPFGIDLPDGGPGRSDDAPGRGGENPGQSDEAPGQTGETPGVTAPGRTGETPGVTAPGQTGETPGVTAPGQTGETPGATAPGRTR